MNERDLSLERIRSGDDPDARKLLAPRFRIRQADVALSTDKPVRVQSLELARPVAPHDHDYHEISLFTAGRCRHLTSDGALDVERGDVILIRPGDVHAFDRITPGSRAINVYYLAEWLDADLSVLWDEPGLAPLFCSGALVRTAHPGVRVFRLSDAERDAVEHELHQLHAELATDRPGQAFMKSCFLKAAALLSRAWCRSDPSWRETTFSPDVWRTLRAVERAIAGGEPFALHAVAEARNVSVDRLSAMFRDAVGFGPVEYFQRRRVQRACQLLGDPRLSITEVAVSLGYADAPHFCRLFKTHRGLTPREYRQTYCAKRRPINPERRRSARRTLRTYDSARRTMIDFTEARRIAQATLDEMRAGQPWVIIDRAIQEESFGWIFPFNDQRSVEKPDYRYDLCGNLPIVVLRASGVVTRLYRGPGWNRKKAIRMLVARLVEEGLLIDENPRRKIDLATITLKPITPESAAAFKSVRLAALLDSPTAFGASYEKESLLTDAEWTARATQWNGDRSIGYLAWENDVPCGVAAGYLDKEIPEIGHLASMWVAPTHRYFGIGPMLGNAILDWGRSLDLVCIRLDVTATNEDAIRLYGRLGFGETGKSRPHPAYPDMTLLEMNRPL